MQIITDYITGLKNDFLPVKKYKIGHFIEKILPTIENIKLEEKEKIKDILNNFFDNIIKNPGDINGCINKVKEEIDKISLKVVSLVSGSGTTMESLVKKSRNLELGLVKIAGVIASKPGIGAIDKATKHKIHTVILNKFHTKDPYTLNSLAELFKADVIIGNGWLPLIPEEVIENFTKNGGIILNQHDGPLRANHLDFGGKGMIGDRVVAARVLYLLETGASGEELFTESTVHIMTENFDEGYSVGVEKLDISKEIEEYKENIKILEKQENFNNLSEQIIEIKKEKLLRELISDIKQKLLILEHKNVADVVSEIGETKTINKHSSYDKILVSKENAGILEEAKKKAIEMYPNG